VAALRTRGIQAERITVRPSGHAYARKTKLTVTQLRWLEQRNESSTFFVADEGPGRSGSSFLSVGEELVAHGVTAEDIIFLGSRPVNPFELCAKDATRRWSQFQFLMPPPYTYRRFSECTYIGGGHWRTELFALNSHAPASWPQMERLKFLSADRRSLFKFEGFGHFGESVRQRSSMVASEGFG